MNKTIGMLLLGLGFIVGISMSVAYAVVADDLICGKCVDKSDLAVDSVGSKKITDQSVMRGDLATDSVVSKKIKDHSVNKVDLDAGAGTSFYIVHDSAVGDGGTQTRTATCDPGDMVAGGGFGAGSGTDTITRSLPLNNDSWRSTWLVTTPGAILQSTAICQDFRPLH